MPWCTEAGEHGPYDAKQVPSSGNFFPEKFRISTEAATLPLTSLKRRPMCQDLLVGLGAPERTSRDGIATEELRYGYFGDAVPGMTPT